MPIFMEALGAIVLILIVVFGVNKIVERERRLERAAKELENIRNPKTTAKRDRKEK